jgi:hypothetical protein
MRDVIVYACAKCRTLAVPQAPPEARYIIALEEDPPRLCSVPGCGGTLHQFARLEPLSGAEGLK